MIHPALCLALFVAVAQAVPSVPPSKSEEIGFLPAFRGYVQWAEKAVGTLDQDLSDETITELDEGGDVAHAKLEQAIVKMLQKLSVKFDEESWSSKAKEMVLEDMKNTIVDYNQIAQVIVANSPIAGQGFRLGMACEVFKQSVKRLNQTYNQLMKKANVEAEDLEEVLEEMAAVEVSFDAIEDSYGAAHDLVDDIIQKTVSQRRRKRWPNWNLGGGFRIQGNSLRWQRGRTSIIARPKWGLQTRSPFIRLNGGRVNFNHRLRNGNIHGFASYNRNGGWSAGVGLRLRF